MKFLVSELIRKKRDGRSLSREEVSFLARGFADDSIPDYQTSAWLMASFIRGLSSSEVFDLTCEIKDSGRQLDWRKLNTDFRNARFVDKHSTGGVGDKVSLILAPVAACLGLKVPMMSGRSLGHTGGTVDKLEAIAGFNMHPDEATMVRALSDVGVCMMAQASWLCPADRKLYFLRDVTATVENVGLITASIVSKKWAEGIDAIVFDVKVGEAAFMSDISEARTLAHSLVATATRAGLRAVAVLTRMDEPLGAFVGNALEVRESLNILRGTFGSANEARLAKPLVDLSCALAAEMAVTSKALPDFATALAAARAALATGKAWEKFRRLATMQGAVDNWENRLAVSAERIPLPAPRTAYVGAIHARALGVAGLKIGVGRQTTDDKIDPAVGFEINVAVGDRVEAGQALLWAHVPTPAVFATIRDEIAGAFTFSERSTCAAELILERITP